MKKQLKFDDQRTLIYEDQELLKYILDRAERLLPKVSQLKVAYKQLEMPGSFDQEIYLTLISNPTKMEQAYKDYLETELDGAGVKNSVLRGNMLRGTDDTLHALKTALTDLKDSAKNGPGDDRFPLGVILIVNEIPIIDDSAIEALTEKFCRVYLNTEMEKLIFAKLETLKKSYNEFLKALTLAKFSPFYDGIERLDLFLNENPDKSVDIRPESIGMACSYAGLRAQSLNK